MIPLGVLLINRVYNINMKNTRKGFIVPVIVTVFALLVLVGGAYYYSHTYKVGPGLPPENFDWSKVQGPTNTATANNMATTTNNWKVYTNAEYGFEFKYPLIFTIIDEGETIPRVIPHQWWIRFENLGQKGNLDISITEDTLVDVDVKNIPYKFGEDGGRATEQVIVGGKKGILFNDSYERVLANTVRLSLGNNQLQISFSSRGDDLFYSNREMIDLILSTFKFAN